MKAKNVSLINRMFGSLYGVWIGFVVTNHYPDWSGWAVIYLLVLLSVIGFIAHSFSNAMNREKRTQRLFGYFIFLLPASAVSLFIINFMATSNLVFPTIASDYTWKLSFLLGVLLVWALTAEYSSHAQEA